MPPAEPAEGGEPLRLRRPPPPFEAVEVVAAARVTPRLARLTLAGPVLVGWSVDGPAASVRLCLPTPGSGLVLPAWAGNEFLLPDGSRPAIRTLTPGRADPAAGRLDVEVVLHGAGPLATWAAGAGPGAEAALSGPGRGYAVDVGARSFWLAGDESAGPAIAQLLEVLPAAAEVAVHLEVAHPDGVRPLPHHPGATVTWAQLPPAAPPGDTVVGAAGAAHLGPEDRVWVAGEAAAVQRVRRLLLEERRLPRPHTSLRGYWKAAR